MIFLIDYENTGYKGLEGIEYLNENDSLHIFYNTTNSNSISRKYLDKIKSSHVKVSLFSLKAKGKNALDFYIASYVGYLIGQASEKEIYAIVSNDNGFNAVRDFCIEYLKQAQFVVQPTIEKCFLKVQEKRSKVVKECMEICILDESINAYLKEEQSLTQIKKKFAGCHTDIVFSNELWNLLLMDKDDSRKIYLDLIKAYGKKQGLEIYQKYKARNENSQDDSFFDG